ncbi:MAG: hypothetical protein RR853_09220 [Aurantimicrobium sp.]|uniref:hypothetical protein n=1 Tax=Aurantimicrobium sp. TaxID=1930784 RepID=UPI002FC72B12
MTETYTFLDKGKVAKPPLNDQYEQSYVTYSTPSPEDKGWSLYFAETNPPTHYFAIWQFLRLTAAEQKAEYPIFHRLAMEYNWKPLESRPVPKPKCLHTNNTRVGFSKSRQSGVYRCNQCGIYMTYDKTPIPPGKYTVTSAAEIHRLRADEMRRLSNLFLGRKP